MLMLMYNSHTDVYIAIFRHYFVYLWIPCDIYIYIITGTKEDGHHPRDVLPGISDNTTTN